MLLYLYIAPSGSPLNISVTSVSSTVISVTWDPPAMYHQNGIIRGYFVQIQSYESNTLDVYNVTNDTEIIVTELKPYSMYYVSVAAYTIQIGPYSEPNLVHLPEAGIVAVFV